ncbi:MAG TPA: hypothetical protein VKA19_11470 [Alphaproteobacteria bacterium]|nr:hypothetical protein [Alphaproteobacteria bacterium]
MTLWVGNDLILSVSSLTDQDQQAVTGATLRATVYESDETTEVSGVTWPLALSDDGAGDYSATIPDTADLVVGNDYFVVVTASKGTIQQRWTAHEVAQRRPFS